MSESFDEDPALAMAGESALIDAPPPAERPEAMLALYRRYRPETFAEVIGQEHVTEPLQRALANNRVNHAYLFSGPRGCGKTTSARILARALNCERGPAPVPCGECDSCRALARGGSGSIDVIEIDAASHGGVDDARDLRERAFFAPVHSRYKIYIVDEAHMVTTAGFNAMLKVVEEPPPHVKFIFATTEPEKVIGTIRSRTHHYPFRLVPPKTLGSYLAEVCESEGVQIERTVLPLVVRAGGGSVRDSLSVLDQLLGGAAESGVSHTQASALLGFTPDSLLDEIVDAFAAGDGAGVFASVDKVIEVGQDPRRFAEDLLRRFRDLVIVAQVPDAVSSGLVDVPADQAERLTSQAAALGTGELTRAAEVLARGITEMRGTTAPRLHLELMCSRILLPEADLDGRGLHARVDRLERRVGVSGAVDEAAPVRPQTPVGRPPTATPPETPPRPVPTDAPAAPPVGEAPSSEAPEVAAPSRPDTPPREPSHPEPPPMAPEPPAADAGPRPHLTAVPDAGPPTSTGIGTTDLRRLWPKVLDEVKRRRRYTWILLSQNAQIVDVVDGTLTLAFPNAGARDNFAKRGSEDVLKDALVQVVGADLHITTIVDGSSGGGRGRGGGTPPRPPAQPSGGQEAKPAGQEAAPQSREATPTSRDAAPQPPTSGVSPVDPPATNGQEPRNSAPTTSQPAPAPEAAPKREPGVAGRRPSTDAVPPPVDDEPPPDPWDEPPPPDAHQAAARPPARMDPVTATEPTPAADPTSATGPAAATAPPPPQGPGAGRSVSQAKEQIRPTRHLRAVPDAAAPDDPFDESLAADAVVIDDTSDASHAELLRQYLGAELIGEEEPAQ